MEFKEVFHVSVLDLVNFKEANGIDIEILKCLVN